MSRNWQASRMSTFQRHAKLYISALAIGALGLTAASLSGASAVSPARAVLAVLFVSSMMAAVLFPIHWELKTKLTLDISVSFATVLLFEPGIAMCIVGLGMLLAQALRRQPLDQLVFNTALAMLQAGAGGWVLLASGWNFAALRDNSPELALMAALAGAVIYCVNSALLSIIAALQVGHAPSEVLRELTGVDAIGILAQLALGALAALVADVYPWAIPLLLPPALAIYRSTARQVELREKARELAHQAFHDPLTKLPNRALFMDRLDHALARTARNEKAVAVLFLDLDRFKFVNDSLGHDAGDQLLVAIAERLRDHSRPQDTVARLGGDEFTCLLEDISDQKDAIVVAERMAALMKPPFEIAGRPVYITCSIGIAIGRSPDDRAELLLRDADIAMYKAKSLGKARYQIYNIGLGSRNLERLQMEGDLRRALEQGEFEVYYQPIVGLTDHPSATGRIEGVEALVRWHHPERGLVMPAEFIPLAEETGLILPLGRWVLEAACRQARAWQLEYSSQPPLGICVNLSMTQFRQPDLVQEVADMLRDTGLAAGSLDLEITENVLMDHAEANITRLEELRLLGVKVAIDDFGTGYSSLSYLNRFPIDFLKIDKSFLEGRGGDRGNVAIVRAILGLAGSLGLQVVAEGIERADQLNELRAWGCQLGQGFLFSEPIPAAVFDAQLARGLYPFELTSVPSVPTPPLN